MSEKPKYYAIIPAEVRYDKRLPGRAALLYGEITVLSNKEGYCWASNNYFAKVYSVSVTTIKEWLKALDEYGYINRRVQYKNGDKKVERRFITLIPQSDDVLHAIKTLGEKGQENRPSGAGKPATPQPENRPDNNTSKNNINKRAKRTSATEKNKEAENELKENFEKLWKLYPKKMGKIPAFRAYKRVMKRNDTTNKQIQDGIVAYRHMLASSGTDRQYIKNGGTFFNQEAWAEYSEAIEEEQGAQQQQNYQPTKFDPRQAAVGLYLDYNKIERVLKEIKEQEIPLDPEEAKRYIEEYEKELH